MLLFQGSFFFTYAAASHHFLAVWLGLTVYLIHSKVKRCFTATPVEVKPTVVHPLLSPQAADALFRWHYPGKDYIFFGGSGHKAPIKLHLSWKA